MTTAPDVPYGRVVRSGPPRDFERLYRSEVSAVTGFFARRSGTPETVADLTAETFLRALRSFPSFDPKRGTGRAWVFAIARRVYAQHCAENASEQKAVRRAGGQRVLPDAAIEELTERIDAERSARELLERLAELPDLDREAVELVDLSGLAPKEAAVAMGVSPGALRVRLFRARARLRKGRDNDVEL